MAREDRLKRYQEAGAELVETARQKAEEFLRDLAGLGEATTRTAGADVGNLVAAGRRSTEALSELVRREITSQLTSLGLATRDDLRRLEARLDSVEESAEAASRKAGRAGAAARKAAPAARTAAPAASKAAPAARKAAPGRSPQTAKTAPTKTAPTKTAPTKTAPARTTPARTTPAKTAAAKAAPAKKSAGPS